MKTATKTTKRRSQLLTDGFIRRGRSRKVNANGYSQIGFKTEDLNRLNEVGRDIMRRTGMAVTARQVVMYLATDYLKQR